MAVGVDENELAEPAAAALDDDGVGAGDVGLGGDDGSVISQELAQTLNLPPGQTIALHDVAGAHDVPSVLIDTLTFGNREIHAIRAPAIAAHGLGSAGLLGLDCLQNQVVIMDFDRHTFSNVKLIRLLVDK